MLKKIIKTHTARLDFVDIIKPRPTFLRNAVTMNRQRRVIASFINMDWIVSFNHFHAVDNQLHENG